MRRLEAVAISFLTTLLFGHALARFDDDFSPATVGIEALGRDFDFRANAYLPVGVPLHE